MFRTRERITCACACASRVNESHTKPRHYIPCTPQDKEGSTLGVGGARSQSSTTTPYAARGDVVTLVSPAAAIRTEHAPKLRSLWQTQCHNDANPPVPVSCLVACSAIEAHMQRAAASSTGPLPRLCACAAAAAAPWAARAHRSQPALPSAQPHGSRHATPRSHWRRTRERQSHRR